MNNMKYAQNYEFPGPRKKIFLGAQDPGPRIIFFLGTNIWKNFQEINFDWEKYPGNKFQLGKSIQEIIFDWEKYPGKNFQLGKTSQNPGVQKPRILGSFFWGMSPVFPGLPSPPER